MAILRLTEEAAVAQTKQAFGEFDWRLFFVADELLKLCHFLKPEPFVGGRPEDLESFHYFQYAQLPYTFSKAHDLWRGAHYLESSLLARHLWEVLVQARYFHGEWRRWDQHFSAKKRSDRVPFRTMFEILSPGSYELVYGRYLSTFAHGTTNFVFRSKPKPASGSSTLSVLQGSEFDLLMSKLLYSFLVGVVLGFVAQFPVLFSKNSVAEDPELQSDMSSTSAWLLNFFKTERSACNDPSFIDHILALGGSDQSPKQEPSSGG